MRRDSLIVGITITVLILTSVALAPTVTYSNPIPSPTIMLKHEYIEVTFSQGPGADGIRVKVTGVYPFRNVGFKELDMYFPIPREVINGGKAWVKVNGRQIKYEVVGEGKVLVPGDGLKPFIYDSVIGTLPMLKWHMKFNGSLRDFTVNVTYTYVLRPIEVEVPCNCSPSGKVGVLVYRTIYAMATGRFYYIYSKRVVADVTLKFVGPKFNYARINVSLVPPPDEVSEGYTKVLLSPHDGEVTKFVIASDLFKGMRRDLLFEIWGYPLSMPTITSPQTTKTVTMTVTNTAAQTTTVTLTKTVTVSATDKGNSVCTASNPTTATRNKVNSETNANTYSALITAMLVVAVSIALITVVLALRFSLRGR